MKKKPKLSKSYHHGDLRARLIEVAIKVLEHRPTSELSLRELAKLAGVSQAAPYRHFKDKHELLAAIGTQAFELKYKLMKKAIEDAKGDPLKTYFGCGIAYFRMGLDHPSHFRLMFSEACKPNAESPELMMAGAATFALVRDMIQICQKSGLIGPGDPYLRATQCWTIVHGFTSLYAGGNFEWLGLTSTNAEKALKTLMAQFLKGSAPHLDESNFGVKLFTTPDSKPYLEMMEQIPSLSKNKS